MKWLEIIELRTMGHAKQHLQRALNDLVQEVRQDQDNPKIQIYKSDAVESDYSIHLAHCQLSPNATGSVLGMRISDSLKTYGWVNHHIWREMEHNKKLIKEAL